jgi:hypothetical protein
MESGQAASQMSSWLESGYGLFLVIHFVGLVCFGYIVWRRLVPLRRAQPHSRFDHPVARLGKLAQYWFGQWKHPRYRTAGILHILIFIGFILLVIRLFSTLLVGVSSNVLAPGFREQPAHTYGVITDYAPPLCSSRWSPSLADWSSGPHVTRCLRDTGRRAPQTPFSSSG